jgi:hypothetical protein
MVGRCAASPVRGLGIEIGKVAGRSMRRMRTRTCVLGRSYGIGLLGEGSYITTCAFLISKNNSKSVVRRYVQTHL